MISFLGGVKETKQKPEIKKKKKNQILKHREQTGNCRGEAGWNKIDTGD